MQPDGAAEVEYRLVDYEMPFDCTGRDDQAQRAELQFRILDELVTVTADASVECRRVD